MSTWIKTVSVSNLVAEHLRTEEVSFSFRMWIRTKIRISTKIKPVSESVSVLNLVAEHLRTEEVLVVDVAEEAEAEVAGVTLSEGNGGDRLFIRGDTAIWK